MDLSIQRLSKSFHQHIVFADITMDVKSGSRMAITGPNGSGKSTFLKIVSGAVVPSSGAVSYSMKNKAISLEHIYKYIHFVAPYNTMIEELTLVEIFNLHQRLGLLRAFKSFEKWMEIIEFSINPNLRIKSYSSGMKQRIKLGFALLDDRPLIFLDEPGSNLDLSGKEWLKNMIANLSSSQTLILATNDPEERRLCHSELSLERAANQPESL